MIRNLDHITLDKILFKDNTIEYLFSATGEVKKFFTTDRLIIQYPIELKENTPLAILTIPFVASILPLAWLTNSILWVKEIDKTFYNSIKSIKAAYQELYPHYPLRGSFVSALLKSHTLEKSFSALQLFSGGVDAQTSFIRNVDIITHLCNIQGWYKDIEHSNAAAETEFNFVKEFAQEKEIESLCIKSNFATLVNTQKFKQIEKKLGITWWFGFNHSMSFISIAIPVAYSLNISKIIIASSYTIGQANICASYVTTDSEFNFATNGITIHDGFELNRQNKISTIANYATKVQDSFHLRVCSFNESNCGYCDKCLRTILGLVAENANPNDFGFDIKIPLKSYLEEIASKKLVYLGIEQEDSTYWKFIKERMRENYDILKEKEMIDFFLSFDFVKARKRMLKEYYIKNFFSIIKRKFLAFFK